MADDSSSGAAARSRRWALCAGPVLAVAAYALAPHGYETEGASIVLGHPGRATIAMTVWMAVWWMSEALPLAATALLPLALFPILGIAPARDAAAGYGHPLVFLFMGGFLVALSMERWGLHRRLALRALQVAGERPAPLVGAFMVTSALLSMWVSNTATAIMMLPVALSLRDPETGAGDQFMPCLLLGIAYACSIGGIATPIGTPPNVFLMSFLHDLPNDPGISFVQWMSFGVPIVLVLLPCAWWLLTRWLFRLGSEAIAGAATLRSLGGAMGALGTGEKSTAAVFAGAALAWVLRPLLVDLELFGLRPLAGLTDSTIAMAAAVVLFILPGDRPEDTRSLRPRALDWPTALRLPWGILILFGGGLSLAAAIRANGVDAYLGQQVAGLAGFPVWAIVGVSCALVIFATELTSNTAITATMVPLLAAVAPGLGIDPLLLAVPATVAASLAFMLPVATPPNAVVFGSGLVDVRAMRRAGLALNVVAVLLLPLLTLWVVAPLLGIGSS